MGNPTRSSQIGAIKRVEGASHWSTTVRGSMMSHPDATVALDNITAATALNVAYVDAGKSTQNNWNMGFCRIPAGTHKLATSLREFNIGETIAAGSTPNFTFGTTASGSYYVIKILSTLDTDVATIAQGTLVNIGNRFVSGYPTTKITLSRGINTFLVLASGTAMTCTLETGTNATCSGFLVTHWTLNQLELWY